MSGSTLIEILVSLIIFALVALQGNILSLKSYQWMRETLNRCEAIVKKESHRTFKDNILPKENRIILGYWGEKE